MASLSIRTTLALSNIGLQCCSMPSGDTVSHVLSTLHHLCNSNILHVYRPYALLCRITASVPPPPPAGWNLLHPSGWIYEGGPIHSAGWNHSRLPRCCIRRFGTQRNNSPRISCSETDTAGNSLALLCSSALLFQLSEVQRARLSLPRWTCSSASCSRQTVIPG